jgi:hypothetical protein
MNIIEKAVAKAEEMMYSDYHINAGIDRKVVTNDWEKDGKNRTYIKVCCYTANGRYKGSYDMGYIDNVTNTYIPGEFDMEIVADEPATTSKEVDAAEEIVVNSNETATVKNANVVDELFTDSGELIPGYTVEAVVKWLRDHGGTGGLMIGGCYVGNVSTLLCAPDYANIRRRIVVGIKAQYYGSYNLITKDPNQKETPNA